jgi:hypothetical protein
VDGLLVLIEIFLVFAAAIGFALWELVRTRRAQRRDDED